MDTDLDFISLKFHQKINNKTKLKYYTKHTLMVIYLLILQDIVIYCLNENVLLYCRVSTSHMCCSHA